MKIELEKVGLLTIYDGLFGQDDLRDYSVGENEYTVFLNTTVPTPEIVLRLAVATESGLELKDPVILTDDITLADEIEQLNNKQTLDYRIVIPDSSGQLILNGSGKILDLKKVSTLIIPKKLSEDSPVDETALAGLTKIFIRPGTALQERNKGMQNLKKDNKNLFDLLRIYKLLLSDLDLTANKRDLILNNDLDESATLILYLIQQHLESQGVEVEKLNELVEKVIGDLEYEDLLKNPELVEIIRIFSIIASSELPEEAAQRVRLVNQQLDKLKEEYKKEKTTFIIVENSFKDLMAEIADTSESRDEVERLTEKLLEDPEIGKLLVLNEKDFKEALTRKLIDLILNDPVNFKTFSAFSDLYEDYIKRAWRNRGLLRR